DAAHPRAAEQVAAVQETLRELDLADKPTLLVLNKADLLDGRPLPVAGDGVVVSARERRGLERLRARIAARLAGGAPEGEGRLPYGAGELAAQFRRAAFLVQERYEEGAVVLRGRLPPSLRGPFERAGVLRSPNGRTRSA